VTPQGPVKEASKEPGRMWVFPGVMAFALICVFFKLFYIQVVRADDFQTHRVTKPRTVVASASRPRTPELFERAQRWSVRTARKIWHRVRHSSQ